MSFGGHIIRLDTTLTGAFAFHDDLDMFLVRCGFADGRVRAARDRAEARKGRFDRALKRFVVQEVLQELIQDRSGDARIVANTITAICKMSLLQASEEAQTAIDKLRSCQAVESREAAQRRAAADQEKQEALRSSERVAEAARATPMNRRDSFLQQFHAMRDQADTVQKRRYSVEKLLEDFVAFEGMDSSVFSKRRRSK
jgi:hypothetical protein